MRNRLLTGLSFAAITVLAAAPAAAQVGLRSDAYAEGRRAGFREGAHDVRAGKDYGFKRDDLYEDGDFGYRGWGSRDAYRHDFRRGYEDGYYAGYGEPGFGGRVYGGGSANEYGPWGYPERGYGAYGSWDYRPGGFRVAFGFGRRDGYEAGLEAARHGRFEPMRHRFYRSTPGYDRRYGDRDGYEQNYRNGFRAGYDDGYRHGRRDR